MAKPYYALKNFCRWSLPASLVPRATALCSIAADMHYEASLPPPPVRCINLTTQQHHLRSVWVWLAGHIKPWCSPCNVCHGVYRRWKDYWRKNWTFLRFLYIFVQCLCALVWEMTLAGCIFFLREMGETTQDFHLQLCITQLQKVHLAIKFSDFYQFQALFFGWYRFATICDAPLRFIWQDLLANNTGLSYVQTSKQHISPAQKHLEWADVGGTTLLCMTCFVWKRGWMHVYSCIDLWTNGLVKSTKILSQVHSSLWVISLFSSSLETNKI